MAIILMGGREPSGVLSVDFRADRSQECTAELEKDLEDLATLYARWIDAFHRHQLLAELNECASQPAKWKNRKQVLAQLLDATAKRLNVTVGALFLRNRDTDRRVAPIFLTDILVWIAFFAISIVAGYVLVQGFQEFWPRARVYLGW